MFAIMGKITTMAVLAMLVGSATLRAADKAVEKRPTTYGEAMAEVARLKAENEALKAELEKLKNPAAPVGGKPAGPVLNDKQLVAKWVKATGIAPNQTYEAKFVAFNRNKKSVEAARKAGAEKDLQIAKSLEQNNGTPELAAAMWAYEAKPGMHESQLKIYLMLQIDSESESSINYLAYPLVWDDTGITGDGDRTFHLTVDSRTRKVTYASHR